MIETAILIIGCILLVEEAIDISKLSKIESMLKEIDKKLTIEDEYDFEIEF